MFERYVVVTALQAGRSRVQLPVVLLEFLKHCGRVTQICVF